MPSGPINVILASGAKRVPGLRRMPMLKLLAAAEVMMLAREHMELLEPRERRRLVELIREARGRPSTLSSRKRRELSTLVAKAEPRLFLGRTADRLSPVPLPRKYVERPDAGDATR